MKSGIMGLQTRGKLADSDPRLQILLLEQQGDRKIGTATVSETVSKRVREKTTRHYWPELR